MDVFVDVSVEYGKEEYMDFVNEVTENDNEVLTEYIEEVLEMERMSSALPLYVSLLLTGNDQIQEINKQFRGKDSPTDVISFAYHENDDFLVGPYDTLGDIVISVERVGEQAKDYNHSFTREFYYVLTHGLLHILGYDHIEEEDKKAMREREEEILGHFGYTRDSL